MEEGRGGRKVRKEEGRRKEEEGGKREGGREGRGREKESLRIQKAPET